MKQPTLKTRGRTFKGTVVSSKAQKTVTVEWMRRVYVPKYERYHLKRSKVKAHNPVEMGAKEGDFVVIKECRPLSKTKNFVVVEVIRK
jgi:small subunit ribosomal protein S17